MGDEWLGHSFYCLVTLLRRDEREEDGLDVKGENKHFLPLLCEEHRRLHNETKA